MVDGRGPLRWAAFLAGRTEGLLDAATLDEMCRPIAVNDTPAAAWTAAHGLGFQVWNADGTRFAGHGGSMPGFLAGLRVNRDTGDGCVALANASSGMSPTFSGDLLSELAEREPVLPEPWTADATQASALELVGDWYWGTTAYDLRLAAAGSSSSASPGPTGARGSGPPTAAGSGWTATTRASRWWSCAPRTGGSATWTSARSGSPATPYDPAADVPGGVDPARWH